MVAEVLSRVFIDKPPKTDENYMIRSENKILRGELKPNFEGLILGQEVKINSMGFRDYEYLLKKEKNTFRIAVLGDSLTFGYGVNFNETYPKILEKKFNQKENKRYKVLNFGVPAYNTFQEAELLGKKVINYSPDLIIVGFYYNDLDNAKFRKISKRKITEFGFEIDKLLLDWSRFYKFLKFSFRGNKYIASIFHKFSTTGHYEHIIDKKTQEYVDFKKGVKKIGSISKKNNISVIWLMLPAITNAKPYPLKKVYDSVSEFVKEENLTVINAFEYELYEDMSDLRLNTIYDSHPNKEYYILTAETIFQNVK